MSQVFKITQKEADIPSNHSNDSFFNEQEMANLTASTSFDLVQKLVTHANEEGFQLVTTFLLIMMIPKIQKM